MRVYQWAKQCGISSKELLRILEDNGVYNKTYNSNIEQEEIDKALLTLQEANEKLVNIEELEVNSTDYYDVDKELVQEYPQALYYICISPRNVGKSMSGLLLALRTYIKEGCPSVLIRRRDVELDNGKLGDNFSEIIGLGFVSSWTKGKYNTIKQIGYRCYLAKVDEDGKIVDRDKQFFMYAIPLAESQNYKGIQLNKDEEKRWIRWIIFDELIPTDNNFLCNEAGLFFNCLSTIIRRYDKARIMIFGNTIVSSIPPILEYMNIDLYSFKQPGEKRLYKYQDEKDLETVNYVVVHFIDKTKYSGVHKKSNSKYFYFGNQKMASITGDTDGEYSVWEIEKNFNGIPKKYTKKDVKFTYYWIYNHKDIYVADIVKKDKDIYIFNHKSGHTLEDKWLDEDKELIFSSDIYDVRKNWINRINGTNNKKVKKIVEILKSGKCYFQNAWVSLYWQSVYSEL